MGIGSIGFPEILVIILLALVFFGPQRMPEMARALGKAMREFRKGLNEVKRELEQAGLEDENRPWKPDQADRPSGRIEPPGFPTGAPVDAGTAAMAAASAPETAEAGPTETVGEAAPEPATEATPEPPTAAAEAAPSESVEATTDGPEPVRAEPPAGGDEADPTPPPEAGSPS